MCEDLNRQSLIPKANPLPHGYEASGTSNAILRPYAGQAVTPDTQTRSDGGTFLEKRKIKNECQQPARQGQ